MKWNEHSHRHGKELLQILHPDIVNEIQEIFNSLQPFPHGSKKGTTVKAYLSEAFIKKGGPKREGQTSTLIRMII